MITGIEHIGLMCRDIPAQAAWYVDYLGFEVIFKSAEPPLVTIIGKGEGMMIELFPWKEGFDGPADGADRQVSHICLYSTDIEADAARLEKAGVEPLSAPFTIFNGGRAVFIRDPEGNYLHLVERPETLW